MDSFAGYGTGSLDELISSIATGHVAMVETCLPGVVVSFDGAANPPRVAVDLAVRGLRVASLDTLESYVLPQLPDVPVLYPGSSDVTIYWPLAAGDEVMVYFASRDTDNALETGEAASEPNTVRRHHLMDAYAVPTPWSRPGATAQAGARDAALVLEHPTTIKLGAGATDYVALAGKIVTYMETLRLWLDANVTPGSPLPGLVDFAATKVKGE